MTLKIKQIDLFDDWVEIIKDDLQSEGYNTDNLDNEKVSMLYFALQKRLIIPKPRNVLKSNNFSCPTQHQQGIKLIEQKIQNGDDLRPHLSKRLGDLTDQDGLLFDWGIHHLHLGTKMGADGFMSRTGPLLYARFDNENAYFINILNHGAWTNKQMIKSIHENWPDSIQTYQLKGVVKLQRDFEDNNIKHLRSAQINTLMEIEDGVVYMGPGGGLAASGDSADAIMKHLQNRKGLKNIEMNILENPEAFLLTLFENLDFIENESLSFKMMKGQDRFYVNEMNNDFQIVLNQ